MNKDRPYMDTLSSNSEPNTTKKHRKEHLSQPMIARKIVAFQEIIEQKEVSARSAAKLIGVANSTMQSWQAKPSIKEAPPELQDFLSTLTGAEFLNRVFLAAHQSIRYGCGGLRALKEFLTLSGLHHFVASSEGALHAFSRRYENYIVAFGEREEEKAADKMKTKKITAALDEMFRGQKPCLVAIEVVSGYILLEKFTEDRKAETWTRELKPRLNQLNLELQQVVSDLCGGIRSSAKEQGAQHIPELFHVQYEISKATAAPLSAQEREFEKLLAESEDKLKKTIVKHGEKSKEAEQATIVRNLRKIGLDDRVKRKEKVRAAKKALGQIHHPIDLNTGKLQTAESIQQGFDDQLEVIEESVQQAQLSTSCTKRLAKAKRAFASIVDYLRYFFLIYMTFAKELEAEYATFFHEVIFPLSYLQSIWRRLPKKDKEAIRALIEKLEIKARDSPFPEEMKKSLFQKGKELAELFQRSSSCVEGRNGVLSLYFHRFHQLGVNGIKALSIIHNYHKLREDGTTAAKRLFGTDHDNLFESLVANVSIPGRPYKKRAKKESLAVA